MDGDSWFTLWYWLFGVVLGCFGLFWVVFVLVYLVVYSSTREAHLFALKGHLLWMDEILHHLRNPGRMIPSKYQ